MIRVERLSKVYEVPVRPPGLVASLRALWSREVRRVDAVRDVSFTLAPGERVGFLGPNGAGKTTTLKMLTGLLHPTAGEIDVLGHRPQARDPELLRRITLVMGQKQALLWDLPPTETFELNRAVFDIPRADYDATRRELIELLDLAGFMDQPTRNLSLGQRMRCELAAALLHRPQVLFLDEPTIGLDVEVQAIVREFISAYNRKHGATVVLTSHDMGDVSAIAERILLIDQGVLRFDGSLAELARRFGHGRRLVVRAPGHDLAALGMSLDEGAWQATAEPAAINPMLAAVLQRCPEAEVSVSDPPLEDVLRRAFGASRAQA
ncbi:MAG TPA: ATP-binding cassette domain-containing protein [Myxococcota bacterium]|nr:ATP-binding cassette domain-containing protein [Myxococcota bacterium]